MKRMLCCLTAAVVLFGLIGCGVAPEETPAQTAEPVEMATSVPAQDAQDASEPPNSEAIDFGDAALEAFVREAIGKSEGTITVADAQNVTELELSHQGVDPDQPYIHDLTALKYFTNLTYLGLGYAAQNAASPLLPVDLSPLSGLTKLESLQMMGLVIDDVTPLATLTNLKSLTIAEGEQLADIAPIAALTQLQALTLRGNLISDTTPLSGLTNLIYLDLEANLITDVTPLAGLTNLTRLALIDNPIMDYTPLAEVRSDLIEWDFEAQATPNMIGFEGVGFEEKVRQALDIPEGLLTYEVTRDVTELDLSDHGVDPALGDLRILYLDAIKYFPNLTKLDLQNNLITGITAIRTLKNLTYLDLRGNPITDFTPLLACPNLTTLYLPEAIPGEYTPDYSVLAQLYPNLTEKNFTLP